MRDIMESALLHELLYEDGTEAGTSPLIGQRTYSRALKIETAITGTNEGQP